MHCTQLRFVSNRVFTLVGPNVEVIVNYTVLILLTSIEYLVLSIH